MNLIWTTEKIRLNDLIEYTDNPRKLSKKDFDRLVKSLKDNGYHQRLIVDTDNVIIGGHQRTKALLAAGLDRHTEIEVLKPNRKLTEDEYRRINIQDNLGYGEFDMDILANLYDVDELIEWGMPEDLFPKVDVIDEVTEEDDKFDTDVETRCKLGDVWLLGPHRLMCGDSTSADNVSKLMAEHKPNLMVTDPPYGVNYDPTWRDHIDEGKTVANLKVQNDDRADWTETYALFTGDIAYVWHDSLVGGVVQKGLEDCDFMAVSQIIWAKQMHLISRGDYHWQHEVCLYAVKKNKKHNWQGARDQTTLWEIKANAGYQTNGEEKTGHSTQKPIECMLRPILNNTAKGEYVYDPFGGSGTTLIAAEKSGRKCLMMELDAKYCDIIINRWEKQTGLTAELDKDA